MIIHLIDFINNFISLFTIARVFPKIIFLIRSSICLLFIAMEPMMPALPPMPPVGYQLVRDPTTGQLIFLPTTTTIGMYTF